MQFTLNEFRQTEYYMYAPGDLNIYIISFLYKPLYKQFLNKIQLKYQFDKIWNKSFTNDK